ncbi:hypothetical protein K9863_09800, partial [Lactobacillaceae bacterium KNUT 0156]|nr:hypothetical protein [Weissella cibaria]
MSKTTARLMLASAVLGFGLWATAGSIHAATAVQPQESAQTTAKIEGVRVTTTNAVPQSAGTMQRSESEYFNNQNMAVVGDSLAVGYEGAHVVEKNYPTSLKEILHPESIDNYGV